MNEEVRKAIQELNDRNQRITEILDLLGTRFSNSEAEVDHIRKLTRSLLIDLEIDAKAGKAVRRPNGIPNPCREDFVPPAYQAYWVLYFQLDLEKHPIENNWPEALSMAQIFLESELMFLEHRNQGS
ncbi:hypothetical protein [Gimesia sp.]|uniref:hypothetical protein n=1 Tax=Gimesia sp. TaxID=2024833 RepID=UPI000C62F9D2|nr:hypothetical protein [Gimesia sp.]MAX36271.1 hypothetical protein [Gimesia sp.]HAH48758.1 hypothetical protein [Planctomycetaceae bacterium]HBL48249.1 hypothetical protein [Planctomycetaceae bacterium]